ncbi:hypothetical protein [Xenophilus sp. Marseille-Q4582]|uniref:hypothetical protein n=1 Tax=Xenophilus sp. Marseille-Q4582 TaxID=2866600 RepID=UPI001CE4A976|nr:hypothetical protein [Xenophilus sp. Marseille-Q4582]
MKALAPLLAVAALAGCATSTPTYGPSGKQAHSLTCHGAARSWATCYENAGAACGSAGYDVISQNGSVTPFGVSNGYANASGAAVSATAGGLVSRNLLIQCRGQ